MEKEMTFEQIDAHINKTDFSKFTQGGEMDFIAADVTNAPGTVLQKICLIYKTIRPILVVISNFPLIPPAWRKAVSTFIGLMDKICP